MMEFWVLKEEPSQTFQVMASVGSKRSFSTQWHRPSPSFASFEVVLLIIHVLRFFDVTYLRDTRRERVGHRSIDKTQRERTRVCEKKGASAVENTKSVRGEERAKRSKQ